MTPAAAPAPWRRLLLQAGLITALTPFSKAMSMSDRFKAEDFFTGPQLAMAQAIDANDWPTLTRLAAANDPARPGQRGMTLMWYAIQPAKPNFAAISALVKLGVNPDTQVAEGVGTATGFALQSPDLHYLQALLDGGLSPNHQTKDGDELLQQAAGALGSLPHVKLLVERGARVDLRDSIGGTALHTAVSTQQADIALYLIARGAPVDSVKSNGVTLAWSVQGIIQRQQPGPMRSAFEQVRDEMARRGVKFPAEAPAVVRQRRGNP